MRKILFMIIGFMFAVQTAFASPIGDKINFEILNQTDVQALFQDNITTQEVIILQKNQMNELKAKGWGMLHIIFNQNRNISTIIKVGEVKIGDSIVPLYHPTTNRWQF